MNKELEIWQFIRERLARNEFVMLLVVVESSGSSPGRAGYKMAVASDGSLSGSIGGGVMEVQIVERSKMLLDPPSSDGGSAGEVIEQVHRENAPNASGMICSGSQTVVIKALRASDLGQVDAIVDAIDKGSDHYLAVSNRGILVTPFMQQGERGFQQTSKDEFHYIEHLGKKSHLFIIGGGHCALALSEVMSRLGFRISIFDDRPELSTIEKNRFADAITIIEDYASIGPLIPDGPDVYVAVMTLGYRSDETVIRTLFDKDFRYFGVLGSRAKMATLFRTLQNEGFDPDRIARIASPIGVQINSQTPGEIGVSIAAEIISVKNK